jgi:hypothetical protein
MLPAGGVAANLVQGGGGMLMVWWTMVVVCLKIWTSDAEDKFMASNRRTQDHVDFTLLAGEPIRQHRGFFNENAITSKVLVDDRDDLLEEVGALWHN